MMVLVMRFDNQPLPPVQAKARGLTPGPPGYFRNDDAWKVAAGTTDVGFAIQVPQSGVVAVRAAE